MLMLVKILFNPLTQNKYNCKYMNYTQNDHYHIRFGHYLGIEHVLALHLYCGYTDLCEKFRKTYRGRYDEKEEVIQKRHYSRFYWFGKFLYEAVEFFGKPNIIQQKSSNGSTSKTLYVGIAQRVLLKSTFAEFHQPTSGTLFFFYFYMYHPLFILDMNMIIFSNWRFWCSYDICKESF